MNFERLNHTGSTRSFNHHKSLAEIEATLRIAQRMPLMSEQIVDSFKEGEAYESLERMINSLHLSLVELSMNIKGIIPPSEKVATA